MASDIFAIVPNTTLKRDCPPAVFCPLLVVPEYLLSKGCYGSNGLDSDMASQLFHPK